MKLLLAFLLSYFLYFFYYISQLVIFSLQRVIGIVCMQTREQTNWLTFCGIGFFILAVTKGLFTIENWENSILRPLWRSLILGRKQEPWRIKKQWNIDGYFLLFPFFSPFLLSSLTPSVPPSLPRRGPFQMTWLTFWPTILSLAHYSRPTGLLATFQAHFSPQSICPCYSLYLESSIP